MNLVDIKSKIISAIIAGELLEQDVRHFAIDEGLGKYVTLIDLSHETIKAHKSWLNDNNVSTSTELVKNSSFEDCRNIINPLIDNATMFALNNFNGDQSDPQLVNDTTTIFENLQYANAALPNVDIFRNEEIIPLYITRNFLAVHRMIFSPSSVTFWIPLHERYTQLIVKATGIK